MNTIAVYPGSFDPITNGHIDIVRRAAGVFERVIVAVLANPRKAPLLSVDERIAAIRGALAEGGLPIERIEVEAFDGLTVDLAPRTGGGCDRPWPACHQRLRDGDAAGPQQPCPGAGCGHGLLHDLRIQRLRPSWLCTSSGSSGPRRERAVRR